MKTVIHAAVVFLAASASFADIPDYTSELVYLGNPAKSRWPTSAISRHVQDLHPYKGKIYTSGGEWGNNTGPCPCFAVDPYSGSYTNEFDAGTDAIYEFKTFSDGLLYCSAVDPHEGAAHFGHTFRREANGTWKAYSNCVRGNLTQTELGDQGYRMHNWDMVEYKGRTFVCGYGISGSDDYCTKPMFDATKCLTSRYRVVTPGYTWVSGGVTYKYTSKWLDCRFMAFLPFDDDLFCFPTNAARGPDIQYWDFNEWRWDESEHQFVSQFNSWDNVCPGVTPEMASMKVLPTDEFKYVQFWHPTKFKKRVLFILGGEDYNITPFAAYSAVNENHHVKSTRIDLGSEQVRPFDIYATEDAVYLVAAELNRSTKVVTNSIWKSTDGVSFTKLFTFTSTRQASALCYYDGSFYVGMGSNADTSRAWPEMTGADVSGNLYRIPYNPGGKSFKSDIVSCKIAEGGSGTVKFCLAEKPSSNIVAKVWTDGQVTTTVKSLTFTTSNWNSWQSVPFSVEQDEVNTVRNGAVICGGVEGIASAICIVTPINDDFAEKETKPEGLVDLTTPDGAFTHDAATSSVVAMNPFNDAASNGDTANRVCVQQKHFSIIYEFPSNAMVNAYSIRAMTINSYAERAPQEWKLFASSDKASWTQIDYRRWEIGWTSGELRYHTCANTKCYKYYKIEFLNNNGDAYTQFARLEYYGSFRSDSTPTDPGSVDPDLKVISTLPYNGTLEKSFAVQTLVFNHLFSGRYLRFDCLTAHANQYAACAEFNLLGKDGKAMDRSKWKIIAVSSQETVGENGVAENMFDGKTSTIWHSEWKNVQSTLPQYFVIDLGEVVEISGFTWLGRDKDLAGFVKDYKIDFALTNGFVLSAEDRPQFDSSSTGLGVNTAKGSFDLAIFNAKKGFYYTAYVTDDLAKPFVASDICIRAEADGSLDFSVPTSDKPSLFVKVVVSSSPKSAGDPE